MNAYEVLRDIHPIGSRLVGTVTGRTFTVTIAPPGTFSISETIFDWLKSMSEAVTVVVRQLVRNKIARSRDMIRTEGETGGGRRCQSSLTDENFEQLCMWARI
jgi:hypothetical protein